MTPPQSAASPCRPDAPAPGLLLLLALLSFAVYGRTLSYELVSDDGPLLRHVEERYRAGGLAGLLASPFEVPSGLPGVSVSLGYYRPVVMASLWLDSRVAPALPQVFHLTNVLLHAGVTVVVFLLGAHLLRSRRAALWCWALFAVHPVHTESVASVAGRTDLWAALFVLLSTLAWLRVRSGASRRPSAERAWGALAFALGSLSKEVAFALPLALSA